MNNPLFSVIIPAYNSEKYIQRCINSVFSKSTDNRNYELLIIDDGSTDNTSAILDKEKENKENILVVHVENHGVSCARNIALGYAKGKYIIFLDADDFLLEDWNQTVTNAMINDVDFTVFDFVKKYDNSTEKKVCYETEKDEMLWCENAFLTSNQMNPCWSRVYKKSIIDRYHIRFDETMVSGEDFVFSLQYFQCCKSIQFVHTPMLYKEERADSVMHRIQVKKFLDDDAKILKSKLEYMKIKNNYELYQQCMGLHFCAITNLLLYTILRFPLYEQVRFIDEICNHPHVGTVVASVDSRHLSMQKRWEYMLLNKSNRKLLQKYLKIKARFIWLKQDIE